MTETEKQMLVSEVTGLVVKHQFPFLSDFFLHYWHFSALAEMLIVQFLYWSFLLFELIN